jgi:hypothetical protein
VRNAKKPSDYVLARIIAECEDEYVLAWAQTEVQRRKAVRESTIRYFAWKRRQERGKKRDKGSEGSSSKQ